MDLHLTGSDNRRLVVIETNMFIVTISGSGKEYKEIVDNFNVSAHFDLEAKNNCSIIKTETIKSDGELGINNGRFMYPAFYDNGSYQIIVQNKNKKTQKLSLYHLDQGIESKFNEFDGHLFGAFDFNGEIGYSNFSILVNGKKVLTFTIEVFPAKMDYRKDYQEIMKDVNQEITALAFEFLGKTYHQAGIEEEENQTASEFFYILKNIYNNLKNALDQIEKRPKHRLVKIERVSKLEKTKRISRKTINYIRKNSDRLIKDEQGIKIRKDKYLPERVIEEKKKITYDIFENRYVKYMLQMILRRIRNIKRTIVDKHGKDNNYYNFLFKVEKQIKYRLNVFFKKIDTIKGKISSSLVFQMAPGYKEVHYYYLMLKKGLNLSEDIYSITPKKIWRLYEIWCYIKLNQILNDLGYSISEHGIIEAKDNGLYLSLVQDKEAVMRYVNSTGEEIELWYNKSYNNLPTNTQRPDNVLCLRNKEVDKKRVYIFDAKYRINISDGEIGPKEEDINVMHRYRDAIVKELDEKDHFSYQTFGAYVMFPCSNEKEYTNHDFYKSIDKVNVGAIPMLPGSTSLMTNHLKKILAESELEAKESIIDHQANYELNDYAKFKLQNVMVANIKDPNHLKAYKNHKFFHIPAKQLSNLRTGIEYIAFYQPKSTFANDSGIKYFAKIDSVNEYKRGECKALPCGDKKKDKKYLRFDLEEIKQLGKKIDTVEYGTVLISYTTLYLLKNATTVHELKIESRKEIKLYKLLKEIASEKNKKLKRFQDYYMLGDNRVELLDNQELRVNGKITTVDVNEILECLNLCRDEEK